MYFRKSFLLLLCLILLSLNILSYNKESAQYQLYLPDTIEGWSLSDKPDIFTGDDLFQHINGGAEIYHEYGFNKVISGVYKNKDLKSINVEIYEMKNAEAAYGIYSFKTAKEGKLVDLNGSPGNLEDYYLNFVAGKFKITLVGFDSKKDTIAGILDIAKNISKILPKSNFFMPEISNELKIVRIKPIHTKYIRGELALFNIYKFADLNLFNIKEGVVGYYEDFKIFVFKYKNEVENNQIYNKAFKYYINKFPEKFKKSQDGFSLIDKKKNEIVIFPYTNLLYIYLGKQSVPKPEFFMSKRRAQGK